MTKILGTGILGTHPSSSKAERQRRARRRRKLGIVLLPVGVDGPIMDLFLRTPGMAITEAQVDATTTPKGREELGQAVTRWFWRSA